MLAHQAELQRYVRFLGAGPALSEDVVQDAFIAAYNNKRVPDLDNIPGRSSWLRKIARNTFLNYCRKQRKSVVHADSEVMEAAENYWQQNVAHDSGFSHMEALTECLKTLPEKHNDALNKRYKERISRKQMAQDLEMSEDGVKSLLRRIRLSLANCIKLRIADEVAR